MSTTHITGNWHFTSMHNHEYGICNCCFLYQNSVIIIDDFRGACAVKGNVQVAGRMSSVSTTHDVTLRNVDGSLFHVQI